MNIPDMDSNDNYTSFNRSKRASLSSFRSGASSNSPYEPATDFLSFNEEVNTVQRRPSKKGVSTFISKLYTMVEDGCHKNLISWNSTGTSFFVCNATQFAQEVLPEYFKHSNFSSFVRLLNMYGFHKINKSPRGQRGNKENEIWEFSHPKFQHSRSEILKEIKRKAMDSELLRREAGDIHANFNMLQISQTDLLQQFYMLQDNFSNLLKGFEETKKVQQQQQQIIQRLAERQGLSRNDLLEEFKLDENSGIMGNKSTHSNAASPLAVFVTSPADQQGDYASMHLNGGNTIWDSQFQQHPLQPTPDVTMSIYDTPESPSPAPVSPNMFDNAVNTPLPHSPVPPMMLTSSPVNYHRPKYGDVNTLGLNF